ncbi:hypothetical protein [Roseovarius aquimarinus]|uniref:Uncharacterized protein n=1 Tax=Roseovarius aquimarinus TaxID=1229156 RepID=A0ABW7I5A2_9RHOB
MAMALSRITGRRAASEEKTTSGTDHFALVRRKTTLYDIARVERHLPEILGRALARGWIDRDFSAALMSDPKGLLARYDVHLADTISIEVEMTETQRQRVVVYERRPDGTKRRVMYLQLVMMAGR